MSGVESSGVTLALVDSSILSCWEEMVKQGKECSLMLKYSKGNVTVKLQSTSKVSPLPKPLSLLQLKQRRGKKEQEETAGETPCLPPTPGGGEGTPSKPANAAASCCGINI